MATFSAPVVPVFLAGTGPAATDMDTLWYQTASFLSNRVVARVSQTTTATTLPSTGATTAIAFDNVIEDPYSGWSSGSHSWTPPAGFSAWYMVTLTVRTAAPANLVDLHPAITAAGTTYGLNEVQACSLTGAGACGTWTVYLVGGQDSVAGACQLLNSAANVSTDLTAGRQSTMEILYLTQN